MPQAVTFVSPKGAFRLPGKPHEIFDELVELGLDVTLVDDDECDPAAVEGWLFLRGGRAGIRARCAASRRSRRPSRGRCSG